MPEETTNTNQTSTSPLTPSNQPTTKMNPEWIISLLFCFFLGNFGVHRFYVGKIGTGILMLVTLGGFGIWILIDLIMIALEKFQKKDGTIIPMKIPA